MLPTTDESLKMFIDALATCYDLNLSTTLLGHVHGKTGAGCNLCSA